MGTYRAAWLRVLSSAVFLLGLTFALPGLAFDHDEYQLVYHESGTISEGYGTGRYGQREWFRNATGGMSIFTRGNLIYFVQRGSVTLYRAGEGMWVFMRYDSKKIKDDVDGTRTVNFSRASPDPGVPLHAWVVVHPDIVQIWDQAPTNPQAWLTRFGPSAGLAFRVRYKGDETFLRGNNIPKAEGLTYLEIVEQYLSTATAEQALPGISAKRAYGLQYEAREAQAKAAAQARNNAARVRGDEIRLQAAQRFQRAASVPKPVGSTVCAADNRIGYVEQVAGNRIKLTLRGFAVGRYGDFGEYGPFSLKVGNFPDPDVNHPILDPHFLFHPLPKPIQVSGTTGVIWDETQYWGVCEYR